eukprot:CAMPEP_0171425364 /NCGR_PEP_ID=MMETSP0881-20121228/3271_1 /TAXON_ID=67004 /ORGANISM="Thalassiosira weissflogii, Strain CCMP1336" /LENGTH=187 /DNA_ID=CAMNT_0011944673 /DNA_START=1394 /DNA_END=1956 /DNA_ORIENTATION=-
MAEAATAPAAAAGSSMAAHYDSHMLFSQQFMIQQRVEDLRQELINEFTNQKQYMQHMNGCIRRIAIQPVVRPVNRVGGERFDAVGGQTVPPKLQKYVKNLYLLWKEYEFGLDGKKPAREFTTYERGQNKCSYSKRKVFWDIVEKLIQRGYTSDTAIDHIYLVYGMKKSNTQILDAMRKDKMQKNDRL